ncbi:exodeoxyribonuclease VII large subunit [Flavobacterium sp.]|uniref:exodeoxyribonuclease VII large subunit n=1 Tax=Flavobacterium sp. TaxID=239 RepID=UPI0025BEC841|nr:exodeoxyribonuclease VII large subunit [Flavobacterium sp.]
MGERKTYRLSRILGRVREVFEEQIKGRQFWLRAEIASVTYHRSGHYYLELMESENGVVLAKCRAMIWNSNLDQIKLDLGQDFPNVLRNGSEILAFAELTYSELYGLQLNVMSIDKSFNVGELERRKQATYNRLFEEGLIGKNAKIQPGIVLQKIALVGAPNSSGHTDFVRQIKANEHKFDFSITEFPCQVQGERAEQDIVNTLKSLPQHEFDVVVLIRGGGSKLDLEVFNAYSIAKVVAEFEIPVFTGIGHETDSSIVDFTANRHFKTPSAVGAFIVDKAYRFMVKVESGYAYVMEFYKRQMASETNKIDLATQFLAAKAVSMTRQKRGELHNLSNRIAALVKQRLSGEELFLNSGIQLLSVKPKSRTESETRKLTEAKDTISLLAKQATDEQRAVLQNTSELLALLSRNAINREKSKMEMLEEIPDLFHPGQILKKGYALVKMNGKVISDANEIAVGDEIEIEMYSRKITAVVTKEQQEKWKESLTKVLQKS